MRSGLAPESHHMKRALRWCYLGLSATAVLAVIEGCMHAKIRDPLPICHATLRDATYMFSQRFGPDDSPRMFGDLEVRRVAGGTPSFLWRIEKRSGEFVRSVTYRKVPDGYAQLVPADVPPEPLREGEEYAVTCGDGIGRFRVTHTGVENLSNP